MKQTLLLLIGMLLFALTDTVNTQTFVGSQTCMTCHNNVNSNLGYNIWVEQNKTGHPYKLNAVSGAPPVFPANTSPGVQNAPPAMPAWGSYSHVIGGYGWKARFIQLSDGHVFTTDTSAQWNLETQQWVPYHFGQATPYNYGCFKCHTTAADTAGSWHPTTPNLGTFGETGIRCEGCHGPGSAHAASPISVDPPIRGDSLKIGRCGDCHQRGGTTNAIPVSGGFIRHHEQLNEMRASRHGDGVGPELTCHSCHDAHVALVYPAAAGAGLSGIRTRCETCHPGREVMLNGSPKQIRCEDCHMPNASKTAVGGAVGNGFKGDIATHIWRIDKRPVPRDSMFAGGFVKLDGAGLASVTLDFACLQCHQNKSLSWAAGWADSIHVRGLTGVTPIDNIPADFKLAQNYPNPFNPTTNIEFTLPGLYEVRIEVYDLIGRHVKTILNQKVGPGSFATEWSGTDETGAHVVSGVYLYKLTAGTFSSVKKMVLVR